jgi:TRAP-type C4-dicarboxylate transport system permease small subunit
MKAGLDRALWWLHRLEDGVLVSLLLSMVVLAVTQIVLRDAFHGGVLWMDTLLKIMVLWIALFGALVGSREQRHVSIDLISRFLSPALKRYTSVLTALFTAGICGALAWFSFAYVQSEYESPSMAFAQIPTWVCESVMPFSFSLISLRYVLHALRMLLGTELPPASGAVL